MPTSTVRHTGDMHAARTVSGHVAGLHQSKPRGTIRLHTLRICVQWLLTGMLHSYVCVAVPFLAPNQRPSPIPTGEQGWPGRSGAWGFPPLSLYG